MRTRHILAGAMLFAVLPHTNSFQLNSYSFGSGGAANSFSSNYALEGTTGELSGKPATGTTDGTKAGYIETQQANVPKLLQLDNNSGQYYNKLHFVIDQQGNPTDAKYLIAVTDNVTSTTYYLQPDGTLSGSLLLTDYQTYTAWGGSTGGLVIGLTQNQSYSVKLKATQGKFTESAYGPATTQSTAPATLTFSLSTSLTATPPYNVSLGTLKADGSINSGDATIKTGLTTNAAAGADIYIKSQNGGLLSGSTGYKINAVSTDLTSATEGFGAQSSGVTQTSGGPLSPATPYDGSANNVGTVSSVIRSLFTSATPIGGAVGSVTLKAKAASTDVAATDYQETLIFIAAGNF